MMKNVVEVRDLVVVRGEREVLPGISLDVTAGVTGLLGPSSPVTPDCTSSEIPGSTSREPRMTTRSRTSTTFFIMC